MQKCKANLIFFFFFFSENNRDLFSFVFYSWTSVEGKDIYLSKNLNFSVRCWNKELSWWFEFYVDESFSIVSIWAFISPCGTTSSLQTPPPPPPAPTSTFLIRSVIIEPPVEFPESSGDLEASPESVEKGRSSWLSEWSLSFERQKTHTQKKKKSKSSQTKRIRCG